MLRTVPTSRVLVLVVGLTIAAACDRAASTPASPASTGAILDSLTVSGAPPDFSVGETAQLKAEASWSNGNREDVTARAAWQSRSNGCTVSSAGVVTAVEVGQCSIEASLASRIGSVTATIGSARTFSITGVVRERYAPGSVPVAGATVTVASGTLAGRTATTDASGRYLIDRLRQESVRLTVDADGFERATIDANPERGSHDVQLAPPATVVNWNNQGATDLTDVRIPFTVTHWGPAAVTISSNTFSCGTYGAFWVSVSRAGQDPGIGVLLCSPGTSSGSATLAPGQYGLQISIYPFTTGTHTVRLTHPR